MSNKNSTLNTTSGKLINIFEHDFSINSLLYLEKILPKNNCSVLYYDSRQYNLNSIWHRLLLQFKPFAPQIADRMLARAFPRDMLEITTTIKYIAQLNWRKRTYIVLDNAQLLFQANPNLLDFFWLFLKTNLPNIYIFLIMDSNQSIINLEKLKSAPKVALLKSISKQSLLKLNDISWQRKLTKPDFTFCLELCLLDFFSFKDALFLSSLGSPDKYITRLLQLNILIYNNYNATYIFPNKILFELRSNFDNLDSNTKKSINLKLAKHCILNKNYPLAARFYYHLNAKVELLNCLHLASQKNFSDFDWESLNCYFTFLDTLASSKLLCLKITYAKFLLNQFQLTEFTKIIQNTEPKIKSLKNLKLRRKLWSRLINLKIFANFPDISTQKKEIFKLQYLQQYQLESFENWHWSTPELISSLKPSTVSFSLKLENLRNCSNYYNNFNDNQFLGFDQLLLAEQNYYQNKLNDALTDAYAALESATSTTNVSFKLMAFLLICKVAIAQGDNQHFSLVRQKLLALWTINADSALEHALTFSELCLNNLLDTKTQVNDVWLDSVHILNSNIPLICKPYFFTQYFYYLLRQSDFKKLINTYLENENSLINNISPVLNIYNYLFLAIAYNQSAEFSLANIYFKKALTIALKTDFIMPFIETFSYLEHFFQKLATETNFDFNYKEFLQKLTPHYKSNANKIYLSQLPPDLTILSSREKEVALLIASGLSNSDIAKQLFIAEITVKKALQNIFRKLQVQNRLSLALLLKKTTPNG